MIKQTRTILSLFSKKLAHSVNEEMSSLSAKSGGMATRKLGEGGGANLKRGMRLRMDSSLDPEPSLMCLHIERVSEIEGNSRRQQCPLSFRWRDIHIPHGLADGE